MAELIYKEEVYEIVGAAMEVHKALDKRTSKEESQVLNYLKASRLKAGVLIVQ